MNNKEKLNEQKQRQQIGKKDEYSFIYNRNQYFHNQNKDIWSYHSSSSRFIKRYYYSYYSLSLYFSEDGYPNSLLFTKEKIIIGFLFYVLVKWYLIVYSVFPINYFIVSTTFYFFPTFSQLNHISFSLIDDSQLIPSTKLRLNTSWLVVKSTFDCCFKLLSIFFRFLLFFIFPYLFVCNNQR